MPPEYTRVLVDGARYSGEIGEVDDLRDVPLANVERIEVLRGTQGLAYGTDSAGGVINVITKDPPLEGVRMNSNVGAGDDAAFLGSGTAAFGLGRAGWSISTVQDQIDGFEVSDSDLPPAPLVASGDSRRISRDVYQTLYVPVTETLTLRTRGGWRREDETFEPLFDENDDGVLNALDPDPKGQRDATRWLARQELDWYATETTRVTGGLSFFQGVTDANVGRDYTLDEDEWQLEGNVERFLVTGPFAHTVTFGVDTRRPALNLDENGPATEDVDEVFYASGVYLQDETELAEWASLLLGVRGEFHSEFAARALPQIGLLFRPVENLKVRASWGQNYRTPSLRDLYQPPVLQEANYFLEGNPNLDPEESESWRLGFEWNPRSWLALAATGFWNDIDGAIRSMFVEGTSPALFRKENLDEVRTKGVEARVLLRPYARWDLSLGYTFMDSEVIDSNVTLDELPNLPRHSADLTTTLRLPRTETALTLEARWRDHAASETSGTGLLGFGSEEQTPRSWVFDLRVLQPLRPGIDLYVDFDNIGDERVVDSYPVRGRTFFVGLRARFDTTTD